MKKLLTTTAAVVLTAFTALSVPAIAGYDGCHGTLLVGKDGQSVIVETHTSDLVDGAYLRGKDNTPTTLQSVSVCVFDTKSTVGRKILKVCKHGAFCEVGLPLDDERNEGVGKRIERTIVDTSTRKTSKLIEDVGFRKIKVIESVTK